MKTPTIVSASNPTRKSTARDVAKEAGVSKWTVARAFTPGASISDHSLQTIREVAQRLGYRPNLVARSLSTKRTNQVAVMVDDFSNPHKLQMLELLTAELQAAQLVAMLIHIGENFDYANGFLTADQRQVDAIVLISAAFPDSILLHANHADGPPLYVLGRDSATDLVTSVACDVDLSMKQIVSYLAGRGYRRPAFMSGPKPSTALGRLEQHATCWREYGVTGVVEIAAGVHSLEAGRQSMRHYLSAHDESSRADVVVCENDVLAIGALDVATREFGLSAPQQIAIVGYDGLEIARLPYLGLTTYEQPMPEMVKALVDMIRGARDRQPMVIPGRLIEGNSA